MKKIISLVLVLAMAFSMLCTAAFAEGSKTELVEVTTAVDEDGQTVAVIVTESEAEKITVEEMTEAFAAVEGVEVEAAALEVLDQDDFVAEKLPVTLTLTVDGTENVMLYVFFKAVDADAWELIWCGMGPDAEITFEANGTYAVAVEAA